MYLTFNEKCLPNLTEAVALMTMPAIKGMDVVLCKEFVRVCVDGPAEKKQVSQD